MSKHFHSTAHFKGGFTPPEDPLTPFEKLQVKFQLADQLQAPNQDADNQRIGACLEVDAWDEWCLFVNTDPDHILNAELSPFDGNTHVTIVDGVSSPEWWDAIPEMEI